MNKRGYVFVFTIVIMTFFVLLYALLVLSYKYKVTNEEGQTRIIGEKQASLFKTYQQGEYASFYAVESSKLSSRLALNELMSNNSGCGVYFGYALWSNSTEHCLKGRIELEETYKNIFAQKLNNFFNQYEWAFIPLINKEDISLKSEELMNIYLSSKNKIVIGSAREMNNVLVTHYYTPLIDESIPWYTGEDWKKYIKGSDSGSWCLIPEKKRGFYEEIKCEGSGITKTGKVYSYKTITKQQETSPYIDKIFTATGTEATPHRTIAVAPDMIPYGSKVKITFQDCKDQACCDAWNGEYVAEDTGIAMRKDWQKGIAHIDMYAGIGKDELKKASCLPKYAKLEVISGIATNSELSYKLNLDTKTKLNYSFDEFNSINQSLGKISEYFSNICLKQTTNQENCISDALKQGNEFEWYLSCESEENNLLYSLLESMSSCTKSEQAGICEFKIPKITKQVKIQLIRDQNRNKIIASNDILSETLDQEFPQSIKSINEGKPILGVCNKAILEFKTDSFVKIKTENCVNSAGIETTYKQTIPMYNTPSPSKKALVAFLDGDSFSKEGNTLNKISMPIKQIKACAKSKYSFLNESGQRENFIYKIAFSVGDNVAPKPVKNIDVFDTAKAEQNITVKFTANEETDVKQYNVYYSEEELTQDVFLEKSKILGVILNDNSKEYLRTFNLPKDGTYYFVVIAVDSSENKGAFDTIKKAESIDDLKPSSLPEKLVRSEYYQIGAMTYFDLTITKPTTNEDGSLLTDLDSYYIYLQETTAESCSTLSIPSIISSGSLIKLNIADSSSSVTKTRIPIENKLRKYCLVVIAHDEAPNIPQKSQYSENNILIIKP